LRFPLNRELPVWVEKKVEYLNSVIAAALSKRWIRPLEDPFWCSRAEAWRLSGMGQVLRTVADSLDL
jgi:hypothetical protein